MRKIYDEQKGLYFFSYFKAGNVNMLRWYLTLAVKHDIIFNGGYYKMTRQEKVIKPKLGLLELGKQLGSVTHLASTSDSKRSFSL